MGCGQSSSLTINGNTEEIKSKCPPPVTEVNESKLQLKLGEDIVVSAESCCSSSKQSNQGDNPQTIEVMNNESEVDLHTVIEIHDIDERESFASIPLEESKILTTENFIEPSHLSGLCTPKSNILDPSCSELDKNSMRREKVIDEIILTERSYVNNMLLTSEIFLQPLRNLSILDASTFSEQFRDYSLIKGLHEQLLRELEAEKENFLEIFLRYLPMMKMYRNYLQYFEQRFQTRSNLMDTNKPYAQFITNCRADPRCKGHYLESFLVEPVQRLPRYKLLFEQVC